LSVNFELSILKENLNKAITDSNFKPADIAKKLKISRSAINRWMSGDMFPSTKNLIKLSKLLEVDIKYFWQNIDTDNLSDAHKKIINSLHQLKEPQKLALLEIIKSMTPPPKEQKLIDKISKLSDEKLKAIMTLADD